MKSSLSVALALCAAMSPIAAMAADNDGAAALALGIEVGTRSPLVTAANKQILTQVGAGAAPRRAAPIVVKADLVQCSQSSVVINDWACTLTFGARTVRLTGQSAHSLLATLLENGAEGDGAMGRTYTSVARLACTISPRQIAAGAGAGAQCSWTAE